MAEFESEAIADLGSAGSCERERRVCGIREECTAEFVLPDYMGDVKRLLKYTAEAVPCNKFISAADVSFLSVVTFRVSYIDASGILSEAVFTADCEHNEHIGDDFSDASISTLTQSVTVRLKGPRKICARAALVSDICITERISLPGIEAAAETEEMLKKSTRIRVHTAEYPRSVEREYAEEIGRMINIPADDIEVVKCELSPYASSTALSDSGIIIKGEMDALAVLRTGGEVMRITKRIPFEETVPLSTDMKDVYPSCRVYVTGVSANLNNVVEDGAEGAAYYTSVVLSSTVEFHTVTDRNVEHEVITDAFYKGKSNECAYESFIYEELMATASEKRKISLTESRGECELREIIDCDVVVKNLKKEMLGSELKLTGEIVCNIIASPNGEGECLLLKCESPFEESVKLTGANESARVYVDVEVADCSVSFDTEKIYVALTLGINAIALEEKKIDVMVDLKPCEKKSQRTRCLTVYYPCEGDTLWSVAKKYSASPMDILKYNTLTDISAENLDASLASLERLIVMEE
ncbi:MAG: DUF3794 domain-containing protein [Ruminococcaceae bacterium]|nr:DUF3794 domain-containing protein [Oscillospiraceae bacterium]